MIVVRNVFQLKFGKAKEAVELWKEGLGLAKRLGFAAKSSRVLTDLVGQYYTLVFESTFESLSDFESSAKTIMSNPEWSAWYAKVVAITESGHREILNVVLEQ
jgi:NIPSNAP